MALCNGRVINPAVLTRLLARLPDQSADSVQKLLFPDDPQDVPRAVELMEAIIEFLACDFGQVNADTAADLDSIRPIHQPTRISPSPSSGSIGSLSCRTNCMGTRSP
jgi:hypothetical protein